MASQGTTLTQSGQQVQELLNKIDNLGPATQEQAGTMSAEDKAKLDGVEAGADVSVNPDWNASGGKAEILNKPTIPTRIAQLDDDGLHRTVTDTEKADWNSKTSFSGNYNDLTNKPDLSQFITKTVNDLVYYYTKTETYTKTQVDNLINAIQTMHYEVYPILPETGAGNVLYLIGPIGTGADKYEEYVYYNNQWKKIGETSIDLSGYVTTTALNTALAAKQDVISDLATIRSGATAGSTAYQKPGTGIPKTDMASAVQTSLGKADTAYQKPSGGIPKTDLASAVQASLDLADSAIQGDPVGSIQPPATPSDWATAEQVSQLEADLNEFNGITDLSDTFVAGYHNASGCSVGDTLPGISSSTSLFTATVTVEKGVIITSNTEIAQTAAVKIALVDASEKIIAFPTTAEVNAGYTPSDADFLAGAKKLYVVYRNTQSNPISLTTTDPSAVVAVRLSNLEKFAEYTEECLDGASESLASSFVSGYRNATGLSVGSTLPGITTSADLMTAEVAVEKDVRVTSNTVLSTTSAVCHALITKNSVIVSFPSTTRINEGFVMTDAEVTAGGAILVVVYRISTQTDPITLVRSISFAVLENRIAKISELGLYKEKTVILCGDSQLGQAQGVDTLIKQNLGDKSVTVLNCGFGGARMSWRNSGGTDDWDAFSMINVADCLVSGDFTSMTGKTTIISQYPYFATAIANLASVDTEDGDGIVLSIAYGGNDFSSSTQLGTLDGAKTTYIGALGYCVSTLLTAFPKMTILLVGIPYRVYDYETIDGVKVVTSDSDDHKNDINLYRYDYNDAVLDAAKTLKTPAFDMYRRSGRNKYNVFTLCPDGTHPTSVAGKESMATIYTKILFSF